MATMDLVRQVLARRFDPDVPKTYRPLAKWGNVSRSTLHARNHGRPSKKEAAQRQQYLTPEEETALVSFLLQMSSFGRPVRIKYLPSLAFSIARQRSNVPTDNPRKPPGKNWAQAFKKRHPEIQARKARAIDWKRHENNIYDKMVDWFDVIGEVLGDPAVLQENVYNMDETGLMLSKLGPVKVIVGKGDPRDYRGAGVKRTMVTAIECISGDGRSLSPLIIWPASTHRSNWTTHETPGWHYAYSENGYNDSYISLQWLKQVFDHETKELAQGKPRILICDGFGTHETLEVLEFCFENNIVLCRLPSHTSHKLQPCDVGVFGPLKTAYRNQVERLSQGGIDTIGKEDFTSLYCPARKEAITKRNIKAAWAATGLFPFNPERVLRATPKPPAESTTLKGNEFTVSFSLDEELRTPVTPITAEAFTSLHNLIKENARGLDETSKRRLQKLASAAQISFARQALLQEQNRHLSQINSEVKVRRSTRSVVLGKGDGKGKVMSYAELEEARVKRAAKEKAAAVKGKRGRKRKSLAPEPEPEPEPETSSLEPKAKVARQNRAQKSTKTSETLWKAPVAPMY